MAKLLIKLKDPSTKISYERIQLNIDYYPRFLNPVEATNILTQISQAFNLSQNPTHKRTTYIYGQAGLIYNIDFKGIRLTRPAIDWKTQPLLLSLRDQITAVTGQCANFCVIQYYPSGKIGIPPHRDKEVTPGTSICGLSLGSSRTLHLDSPTWWKSSQPQDKRLSLNLCHGSLYVLNPPTNDCWAHSIDQSDFVGPRLSLTFRLITDSIKENKGYN